jgi:type IX secretion system PorP/SprF family membrane protein
MKKIFLFVIAFISLTINSFAQYQYLGNFVQFFNNETYLNPAFAGTQTSGFNISAITRVDYAGIISDNKFGIHKELITIDKRFDEKNFALAFNLNSISNNGYRNFELAANYSYHLNLGHDRKLCMGLKAGGIYSDRNVKLELETTGDKVFNDQNDTYSATFLPKIGAGFLYKDEKTYLGISSPDVVEKINLTGSGGYKFSINEDLYLQPNSLVRYASGSNPKIDINTLLGKNESFWFGLNYSVKNSIALMGALYINGRIELGYAFDYNVNFGYSSHEIMLQWDIEDVL